MKELSTNHNEFLFILNFITENDFDGELLCDQLRSLWTAYCIHHNYYADTSTYDRLVREMWKAISAFSNVAPCWSSFTSFDDFMCAYLV